MRETNGTLGIAGQADPLIGTMGKGVHNRVLRIDATITVFMEHALPSLGVRPWVNDLEPYPGAVNVPSIAVTACDWIKTSTCTVTGSFWFDLDALEAANPGTIIGKPLVITLNGGSPAGQGDGLRYSASFSAELVKK